MLLYSQHHTHQATHNARRTTKGPRIPGRGSARHIFVIENDPINQYLPHDEKYVTLLNIIASRLK